VIFALQEQIEFT